MVQSLVKDNQGVKISKENIRRVLKDNMGLRYWKVRRIPD